LNSRNTNKEYKLGKSIAQIVPFQRPIKKQPKQQKEIITNKLVITMVVIAIVKIAVLIVYS
jgi:hypothetical protein